MRIRLEKQNEEEVTMGVIANEALVELIYAVKRKWQDRAKEQAREPGSGERDREEQAQQENEARNRQKM